MAKTYGPYSSARKANGFVFISGQIGIMPGDESAPAGIEAQTMQVLENLSTLLEENGTSVNNVVKTTIFLKHMSDFQTVNHIYGDVFHENKPARATVEVSSLPIIGENEILIEIEAIATE